MPGQAIVQIGDKQWSVQVATTPAELAQGLSGVESILPYTGVLFDLGSERIVNVTTEFMLFPISIVFFGDDLKVTEVAPITWPGETDLHTMYPARFFMEVNVEELEGVQIGDQVVIAGYTPTTSTTSGSLIELMVTVLIVTMMMKMMMGAMEQDSESVGAKTRQQYTGVMKGVK